MVITLIGIDAATDPRNTGVVRGTIDADGACLTDAGLLSDLRVDTVASWVEDIPALVAIDAPLGWPKLMSAELPAHIAGGPILTDANFMFRRSTDRIVQELVRKRPLEVGADRIARTAHAGLRLLQDLRERSDQSLELAWAPRGWTGARVIEVYPAATLLARGISDRGYKGRRNPDAELVRRREIVADISAEVGLAGLRSRLEVSDHLLDAAICTLAAVDFLRGAAMPPLDNSPVTQEGWIWVKRPPTDRACQHRIDD